MDSADPSPSPDWRPAPSRVALAAPAGLIACIVFAAWMFAQVGQASTAESTPVRKPQTAAPAKAGTADNLVMFEPQDTAHLVRVLGAAWEAVEEGGAAPNVAPSRFPPGLGELAAEARKQTFLRAVLPHLLETNRRVAQDRSVLLALARSVHAGRELAAGDISWVEQTARKYRLRDLAADAIRGNPAKAVHCLLERVDIVPPSLALAQAAVESGWGGSRFLLEGNNLFGQWVFDRSQGIAPLDRPDGANYAIATYRSLGHSVRSYVKNLNTSWAYEDFRGLRAGMRRQERPLSGDDLAAGLLLYSERRELYVREVRQVIRGNALERFDHYALEELGGDWQARAQTASGKVTAMGAVDGPRPDA